MSRLKPRNLFPSSPAGSDDSTVVDSDDPFFCTHFPVNMALNASYFVRIRIKQRYMTWGVWAKERVQHHDDSPMWRIRPHCEEAVEIAAGVPSISMHTKNT